jgi:hypothetical protein
MIYDQDGGGGKMIYIKNADYIGIEINILLVKKK